MVQWWGSNFSLNIRNFLDQNYSTVLLRHVKLWLFSVTVLWVFCAFGALPLLDGEQAGHPVTCKKNLCPVILQCFEAVGWLRGRGCHLKKTRLDTRIIKVVTTKPDSRGKWPLNWCVYVYFYCEMHFGSQAPSGPTGELTALPLSTLLD